MSAAAEILAFLERLEMLRRRDQYRGHWPISVIQNAKGKMQNANRWRRLSLHFAFCVLRFAF